MFRNSYSIQTIYWNKKTWIWEINLLTNSFIKEVEGFRLFWPAVFVFCLCNNVVHCSWLQVFQRVGRSCWELVFYLKVRYWNENRFPISRWFVYYIVLWYRQSLLKIIRVNYIDRKFQWYMIHQFYNLTSVSCIICKYKSYVILFFR